MSDNPFSGLPNIIREDNKSHKPAAYRFGTVITVDPLTVDIAETVQDKDDLLKSDGLNDVQVGDMLLLIPIEDEQRYVIICKVVNT